MIQLRTIRTMIGVLASFVPTLFAQEDPGTLREKVDTVFANFDKTGSPGCALGIFQNSSILYARGYGTANLEHDIPITPRTVFDIGSTSKQFTAASILLLAQQAKLRLDDDIRKLLPEMPNYGLIITIGNLLHHTSGIRDYLTLMNLAGLDFDGVTNDEDALALIVRQKALNFAPGDEHLYSNSGFFLLSMIVKRAGGKSLREFAQVQIFAPLEMKDTHYHDDHTLIVPRRATGYAPKPGGGFRVAMSGFEQTGDGAVYTTVNDLLLWDRNFYDPKVGGKSLLEQLQTLGMLNSGERLAYARGLVVEDYKGLKSVSHGGSWAGYRAELLRFPEQKTSVACLCNLATANPSQLARRVADVVLAEAIAKVSKPAPAQPEKPVSAAITKDEMESRVGIYRNSANGTMRRVSVRSDKLWLDALGPSSELIPIGPNRFRVLGAQTSTEVEIIPRNGESPRKMRISRAGIKLEVFETVESVSPTADQLQQYVGGYYSAELEVSYQIFLEEDRLWSRVRQQPKRALAPLFRDAFLGPGGGQYEFSRNTQGQVAGFMISAGRIRNVQFVRQPQ